ncbi:phosphotransferase [Actinoplanes sp. NPDC051859]|uniref:phosphotransferase n=1 Tax=Actinoplanes sp. NPDC051859 TaxID=3363909 RepID=UPI00378A16AC
MTVVQTWHARAGACLPGVRLDDAPLHRTDKAVLLSGVLDDLQVVVKLLVDDDPFWRAKFTAEIATYRAFDTAPPPVAVPRLIAAEPAAGVLAVTRLPGRPVAADRYPTELDPAAVQVMLDAAGALQSWTAPDRLYPAVWDYPYRFARYRTEYGLLDDRDEAALTALAAAAGPMRLAHGDLLPTNVLRGPDGVLYGVLDWEFTGRYLPGLDAALLWLILGRLPGVRPAIEQLAGSDPAQLAGFWTNVATLAVRELRTHGELEDGPLRTDRLPYLEQTWDSVRARVHELAGVR